MPPVFTIWPWWWQMDRYSWKVITITQSGKRRLHGVDGFQPEADEMMEMDHVGLQVAQDAHEIPLELLGVPVGDRKWSYSLAW